MVKDRIEDAEKIAEYWQPLLDLFSPQVQPFVIPILILTIGCFLAAFIFPLLPFTKSKLVATEKPLPKKAGLARLKIA